MEEEKIIRMPMIGDTAPSFRSITTKGKINFPDDYKGKWVVFFSHPADFTPVCTTEFIAFAKRNDEFKALNTELLGLSIDSLHSHLAWVKNIENIDWKGEGKVSIPFPIVADISMNVAKMYGMLQTVAKTQTIRAVFIIDPEYIVRTILYYPMSTGRNIDEIIRIIKALQKHDKDNVSTPVDWTPGDDVLMGSPLTLEEASDRIKGKDDLIPYEWYLTAIKDSSDTDFNSNTDFKESDGEIWKEDNTDFKESDDEIWVEDNTDFKESDDEIWIEDNTGKKIAYIEFPEFEPGKVEVTHTVVDESLRGQGIAGKLTKQMAQKLIKEGKKAELTCSYSVKWFAAHKEFGEALIEPEKEYEKAMNMPNMACGVPKHGKDKA